jgi:hypothetical protein
MPAPAVPQLDTSSVIGQGLDDPPWISRTTSPREAPPPEGTPREVDWGGGNSPRRTVGHASRGPNAAGMLARGEAMGASRSGLSNFPRAKDRLDILVARRHSGF